MKRRAIGRVFGWLGAVALAGLASSATAAIYWDPMGFEFVELADDGDAAATQVKMDKTWFNKVVTDDAAESISGVQTHSVRPVFNAGVGFQSDSETLVWNVGTGRFDLSDDLDIGAFKYYGDGSQLTNISTVSSSLLDDADNDTGIDPEVATDDDTVTLFVQSINRQTWTATESELMLPLEFDWASATAITTTWHNTDTGNTATDGLEVGLEADEDARVWQYENNALSIGTNNVERIRVLGDGKVGFGIVPISALDIDTGSSSEGITIRGLAETVEIAKIYVAGAGPLVIDNVDGTGSASRIDLAPEDNNWGVRIMESDGTGGAQGAVYANFYVVDAADDYLNIRTRNVKSSTSGVFITQTDRVGVNDSSPSYDLDVNGTGRFIDDLTLTSPAEINGSPRNHQLSYGGFSWPGPAALNNSSQGLGIGNAHPNASPATTSQGIPCIRAGSFTGISANFLITSDNASSVLVIRVYRNTTLIFTHPLPTPSSAATFTSTPQTQARGTDTFDAGDVLSAYIVETNSQAVSVDDVFCTLEVYYD